MPSARGETVVLLDSEFRDDLGRIVRDVTRDAAGAAFAGACQELLEQLRGELPRLLASLGGRHGPAPQEPQAWSAHHYFGPRRTTDTEDLVRDGMACLAEPSDGAGSVRRSSLEIPIPPLPGSLMPSLSRSTTGAEDLMRSVPTTPNGSRRRPPRESAYLTDSAKPEELNFRSNFTVTRVRREEAGVEEDDEEDESEREVGHVGTSQEAGHSDGNDPSTVSVKTSQGQRAWPFSAVVAHASVVTGAKHADGACATALPAARTAMDREEIAGQFNVRDSARSRISRRMTVKLHQMHWMPDWARHRLAKIVRSQQFDYGMGMLLFSNAIAIGLQVDFQARGGVEENPAFQIMGWFFCMAFSMELGIRMLHYGRGFFWGSNWQWNYFDILVVSTNVMEEVSALFLVNLSGASNLTLLRVVRVLRLLRVFRLVRILRLVRELNIMVSATIGSARSFAWTVALMLMMFYICGIFLTQIVTDNRKDFSGGDLEATERLLITYYGSLGDSVLSLFQAMTGGMNWNDLLHPLRVLVSPIAAFVFSCYIAFAMLVMMNLVTGIFVDSAQASIREHRDLDLVNRVRELFRLSDKDGSGEITWEEFSGHVNHPHMEEYFRAVDLDPSEARGLWLLLDANDSGSITAEDFVNGCLRLRGSARSTDMAAVMYNMRSKFRLLQETCERLERAFECLAGQLGGGGASAMHSKPQSPWPDVVL